MNTPNRNPSGSASSPRERISCPGCGRHDWVTWAKGAETYHWKCFNCEKSFDLVRKEKH